MKYLLLLLLLPLAAFFQAGEDEKPNGFDVSISNIDTSNIHKGGPLRDGIPAIDRPVFITVADATWMREADSIVGVVVGDVSRAYPLRILQYHECVNDVIGDRAIAVTYCPLCQSSFVFDRTFGDTVYDFGTSGMLWNSNVLLYDRQTESLWSQAAMKAVTGKAAEQNLTFSLLPATLSTWGEWIAAHPDTSVLSTETGYKRDYHITYYAPYFSGPKIWFEVDSHLKNPREFALKDKMLLVQVGKQVKLYAIKELIQAADDAGVIKDRVANQDITIHINGKTKTARVDEILPNATMYWFAASACLPKATLWNPPNDQKTQE